MNEAPSGSERRRSIWRFSLRELLLVMLAAGAFVGWGILLYERSQRFVPSAFYEYAPFWRDDIVAALTEMGENASNALPFAVTHANGPSVHRSESYSFPLSPANSSAFHQAIRLRGRQRLLGAGCMILGEAGGSPNGTQVTVMEYRLGSRTGALHICTFKGGDDQGRVVITMHEEGAWRGGFNVGVTAGS